jgi:hypothetical protein
VWVGPLIGVALGVLLVGALLRAWRRPGAAAAGSPTVPVDVDVADEFHRFREEYGQ